MFQMRLNVNIFTKLLREIMREKYFEDHISLFSCYQLLLSYQDHKLSVHKGSPKRAHTQQAISFNKCLLECKKKERKKG